MGVLDKTGDGRGWDAGCGGCYTICEAGGETKIKNKDVVGDWTPDKQHQEDEIEGVQNSDYTCVLSELCTGACIQFEWVPRKWYVGNIQRRNRHKGWWDMIWQDKQRDTIKLDGSNICRWFVMKDGDMSHVPSSKGVFGGSLCGGGKRKQSASRQVPGLCAFYRGSLVVAATCNFVVLYLHLKMSSQSQDQNRHEDKLSFVLCFHRWSQ